jgi:hypothetical protein
MTAASDLKIQQENSNGLTSYYKQKIEHLEMTVRDKTQNLRRLQAQRNELNSKGKNDKSEPPGSFFPSSLPFKILTCSF